MLKCGTLNYIMILNEYVTLVVTGNSYKQKLRVLGTNVFCTNMNLCLHSTFRQYWVSFRVPKGFEYLAFEYLRENLSTGDISVSITHNNKFIRLCSTKPLSSSKEVNQMISQLQYIQRNTTLYVQERIIAIKRVELYDQMYK